jgi:hypothetical protein
MGRSLRHRAPADRSLASRTSATHLMKMFRSVLLAKDSLIPSPPQDKGLVSYEKTWRCSTNGSSNTALREHALLPSPIACSSLPFAPFAGCDYTGRVLYGIPHCKTRRFVRHCVPHCDAVRSTFVLTCFGTSYPVATFSQYADKWISSIEELKGTGTGKRDERQRRDGAQEGVFIHEQPIKQFLRPFCLRAKKRA